MIYLIQYIVLTEDNLACVYGGQRHSAEAVNIAILACEQQILNLCYDRHLRQHNVVAILRVTTHSTLLYGVVVAYGER